MYIRKILPSLISMLLFGILLLSIRAHNTKIEKKEVTKNSQKVRYTFSLQLFQTI